LRRIKKGLEPLIAAVILIAITLVIAIAVVGWMSGLFATTISETESLVILPNASLFKRSGTWYLNLTIRNTGVFNSSVTAVFVGGFSCTSSSLPQTIPAGGTVNINDLNCGTGGITPGNRYTIKVMTAAGNTFYSEVIASP
jgi:flagellin-like protein